MPAPSSWCRAACHPSKYQWSSRAGRRRPAIDGLRADPAGTASNQRVQVLRAKPGLGKLLPHLQSDLIAAAANRRADDGDQVARVAAPFATERGHGALGHTRRQPAPARVRGRHGACRPSCAIDALDRVCNQEGHAVSNLDDERQILAVCRDDVCVRRRGAWLDGRFGHHVRRPVHLVQPHQPGEIDVHGTRHLRPGGTCAPRQKLTTLPTTGAS